MEPAFNDVAISINQGFASLCPGFLACALSARFKGNLVLPILAER